ncbi:hypothetical protein KIPB_010350 [Kipferlia bialata]|uniref:Uncharacterized protein n=1 Tax=Kipferlia bialata TaxID=797122 RepID=A0A391NPQ8_9EUKA|nr:hypothetical protein KIPB_010350 [Kipferlia bialata]|eukprot:g10350.t1
MYCTPKMTDSKRAKNLSKSKMALNAVVKDAHSDQVPSLPIRILPSYVEDTVMTLEVDTTHTFVDHPDTGFYTTITLPASDALDVSVAFYDQVMPLGFRFPFQIH